VKKIHSLFFFRAKSGNNANPRITPGPQTPPWALEVVVGVGAGEDDEDWVVVVVLNVPPCLIA